MKCVAVIFLLLFTSSYSLADYKSDIHARMNKYYSDNQDCYTRAANLSEQTECAKNTVTKLNQYMDSFLTGWYPNLMAGPRGNEVYNQLVETQNLWIQYRRDLCNFAADAKGKGDKNLAAFHGLHCVISVTIARMRELNPIR
ncbi:hypothetical protein Maq22A_2p40895 (plasmid) [Methylobacterium aquaticum]|uniref:Lysozyme inhibitor LprI-like N-terminal domain-containing protein n=2 Tax=Methylobacterium TaxID=407 RepID=A0A0C6FWJ3_9HYPH|nr:hypothetical protein Maq22A_2p40895 [Methylobacterium aquaticum]